MNKNIMIRTYTDADYPAVKQLLLEADMYMEPMDSRDNLKAKSKADPESQLVAEVGRKIAGSVSLIDDKRLAYIFRLVVARSFRKQGIGNQLMAAAEKALSDRGHKEANILVSHKDDELQQYYEKHGYKKGNVWRWMWKELGKQ